MTEQQNRTSSNRTLILMIIAFLGIFVYGLLAALPGSVLPTLERNQFLPSDSAVGTFLLINAVGAVLAYAVSGPIIDRICGPSGYDTPDSHQGIGFGRTRNSTRP